MDLTVVIPARNEEWLARTVADVAAAIRGRTEIIAVLDGGWIAPPLTQHGVVSVIRTPEAIGQRAATNLGIRLARGKLVMKLDGHCSVQDGFDLPLIAAAKALGPSVCQVPAQYNLHVFDWVCPDGHRRYQGPTPKSGCDFQAKVPGPKCGLPMTRDVVWQRRRSRLTTAWRFDSELHFQYWTDWGKAHKDEQVHDIMTCLGACWVVDRQRFIELGMLDESHGSWGQMGTEIACKYWLSGGRLVVNKGSWFAHLFRTQGGDFGFPYPLSGDAQRKAREHSQSMWRGEAAKWPHARRNLRWMLDRFWPVPGWTEEQRHELGESRDVDGRGADDTAGLEGAQQGWPSPGPRSSEATAGIVFYTDGRAPREVLGAALGQVRRASEGQVAQIVRVGLEREPASHEWVDRLVVGLDRGPEAMFQQILTGLIALDTDIAFMAEHDGLYHESHFFWRPPSADAYYYDVNWWKVDLATGKAITYQAKQVSGLAADRQLLIRHYSRRLELVRSGGFTRRMGFEPGSHRRAERVDDVSALEWRAEGPSLDIRHGSNYTATRWSREGFRSQSSCRGWAEAPSAPGWPYRPGNFTQLLNRLAE
jgi:hypothetical protein